MKIRSFISGFSSVKKIGFVLGPLLAILLFVFFNPDSSIPQVGFMAGIALLMAIWWITESVPLAVTALIPVALFPLFGIMAALKSDKAMVTCLEFNPDSVEVARKVLKRFNKSGYTTIRKSLLLGEGFNPKFFTHYWKNQKGDVYLFIYEYGFLKKKEHNIEKFVLIKWQDYMGHF